MSIKENIEQYNRLNPDDIQPVTDKVITLLNDIEGIKWNFQIIDSYLPLIGNYENEFEAIQKYCSKNFKESKLQSIEFVFGGTPLKIESEILRTEIHSILKKHLKRSAPKIKIAKKKAGQPAKSSRILEKSLPIVNKLKALGLSNEFLSIVFSLSIDNFNRTLSRVKGQYSKK